MNIGIGIGIPNFGRVASGIASSINFAQLVTGDVPSGWTFTRSTAGTYFAASGVLQLASTNVLRISRDPVSGELGYLAEPGRTNLLLRSQEFDNASWVKSAGVSISANAATAPDGTLTGDSLVSTTATNSVYQTISVTPATTYTAVVFLKYVSTQWVRILYSDGSSNQCRVWVDIQNGVLGTGSAGGTATYASSSIVPIGDGWYRVSVTGTQPGSTGYVILQGVSADASSTGVAGTFYAWGAQLEAGSYPTSYIPTTTVAVSRGADLLTTTLSAAHAAALSVAGTMVARYTPYTSDASVVPVVALDSGTTATTSEIYRYAGSDGCRTRVALSTQYDHGLSHTVSTAGKVAYAWAVDNCRGAYAGSLMTADVAPSSIASVTNLSIGCYSTGVSPIGALIHSIAVYTSRLTDAQLQALTA